MARVQKIINADPERINVSKNGAFAIALATEMFIQHLATTTHNVVKAERKPRRNIQYRDVSSAVAKTDNLEFATDVVPRTTTYKEFKKRVAEGEKAGGGQGGLGKWKGKEIAKEGVNGEASTTTVGKMFDAVKDSTRTNGMANGNGNGTAAEPLPALNGDANPIASTSAIAAPQQAQPPAAEAMEVDAAPERVEDSDPEEDPAAMQLEMEMRGPQRPSTRSPEQPRRSGGFTAVNGSR